MGSCSEKDVSQNPDHCKNADPHRSSEEVLIDRIEIRNNFEIQKFPFTQAQFFWVRGYNPAHHSKKENCPNDYVKINGIEICPYHPVDSVHWDEVLWTINDLNLREAYTEYTYRQVTEAEWEYILRSSKYNAIDLTKDETELSSIAWNAQNSDNQTHKVCEKWFKIFTDQAICDLYGNVWELVQDFYFDLKKLDQLWEPDLKNGQRYLPISDSDDRRPDHKRLKSWNQPVVRGGSYRSKKEDFRASKRISLSNKSDYYKRYIDVGFRLVRTRK